MESGAADVPAGEAGPTAVDEPDSDAPHRAGTSNGRFGRILVTVVLIVAADQATKSWAVAALSDGPVRLIGDTVELHLSRNPGGAFSSFRGATPVLATLATVMSVWLWRTARRVTDRWMLVGLVLVLSGALGNLVDRVARSPGFMRGHVVDFVSVGWWPVFNLADSAISIGAVLLIVRGWFAGEDGGAEQSAGARG